MLPLLFPLVYALYWGWCGCCDLYPLNALWSGFWSGCDNTACNCYEEGSDTNSVFQNPCTGDLYDTCPTRYCNEESRTVDDTRTCPKKIFYTCEFKNFLLPSNDQTKAMYVDGQKEVCKTEKSTACTTQTTTVTCYSKTINCKKPLNCATANTDDGECSTDGATVDCTACDDGYDLQDDDTCALTTTTTTTTTTQAPATQAPTQAPTTQAPTTQPVPAKDVSGEFPWWIVIAALGALFLCCLCCFGPCMKGSVNEEAGQERIISLPTKESRREPKQESTREPPTPDPREPTNQPTKYSSIGFYGKFSSFAKTRPQSLTRSGKKRRIRRKKSKQTKTEQQTEGSMHQKRSRSSQDHSRGELGHFPSMHVRSRSRA